MTRPKVTIVSATRLSREAFWRESLLGRSLLWMPEQLRPELALRFDNRGERLAGLPEVYNRAIDAAKGDEILCFVHDDVFVHDQYLEERLAEGLSKFDVLGLAGSRGGEGRLSWAFSFDEDLERAWWKTKGTRHGSVSHAAPSDVGAPEAPRPNLSWYGESPARCDLLDGVLLAARASTLIKAGVRFDERFRFHLYDMDFSRAATEAGLSLGVWPILVTHASGGAFLSEEWKAAARLYRDKWDGPRTLPSISDAPATEAV